MYPHFSRHAPALHSNTPAINEKTAKLKKRGTSTKENLRSFSKK